MDTIDRAQKDIEVFNELMHADLHKDAEETGYCLWCNEKLEAGRRWCDAECRDFWQAEQNESNKWRKINGK